MPDSSIIPVLIVGAGPVGLIAALTLRKNGVPVRIIEKDSRVHVGQRGAAIMPRTQEIYKSLGILDDIHAKATPMNQVRMYRLPDGVEPLTTFVVEPGAEPSPARPYRNTSMLGQDHTEEILRTHIGRYDCQVEFGTALAGFRPEDGYVLAHVVKMVGDKEILEIIKCRWLIGTDGARGIVRKQLGLAFNGETLGATHHMVIGDIEMKGLDNKYWHYWGDMSTIMVMLRATEDDGIYFLFIGGHIDHAKVVAERAELERVIRIGTGRTDIQLGKVRYVAQYRPHVRMAVNFGKGRVLIAGDAAHIHSPFGGQGLNSGVQDAVNLAWKLSLVEKGVAAPLLLDTYAEERIPVIAEMLKATTKLFDSAMHVKAWDSANTEKAWRRGGELHMFGVNYRWSSIVVDERTPKEEIPVDPYGVSYSATDIVRAGDRAPNAPGLIILDSTGGQQRTTATSLFDIFGPSYHTVMVFCDGTDKPDQIWSCLGAYPLEILRKVLVCARSDDTRSWANIVNADVAVVDRDAHVHAGYQVQEDELVVIIVRPDGMIGGIVRSAHGVKQYFDGVFGAFSG
ncbi:monooxygenase [Rhodofomes roseus]|uniref:Monooxygenase n=1 Tax=Rhodofomes roseus TaxID=34475 RepID=A0A4Y9YGF4_9APHY|nr:monooxygenase [Rhodofomes roseus]KAH9840296.1 monooxygenase [Rhodofomes roseus]TFY61624.1 hypothetical protein EVJ58_g4394 [Rhodofomes roseus]